MIKLFIALSGLAVGVIIAMFTREELVAGKKYFVSLQRVLFIITVSSITYFLSDLLWLSLAYMFLAIGIFLVRLKFKHQLFEFLPYLLFIPPYFIIEERVLVASFIFLYGIPTGTLLKSEYK